jgi:hypothetical protein
MEGFQLDYQSPAHSQGTKRDGVTCEEHEKMVLRATVKTSDNTIEHTTNGNIGTNYALEERTLYRGFNVVLVLLSIALI